MAQSQVKGQYHSTSAVSLRVAGFTVGGMSTNDLGWLTSARNLWKAMESTSVPSHATMTITDHEKPAFGQKSFIKIYLFYAQVVMA